MKRCRRKRLSHPLDREVKTLYSSILLQPPSCRTQISSNQPPPTLHRELHSPHHRLRAAHAGPACVGVCGVRQGTWSGLSPKPAGRQWVDRSRGLVATGRGGRVGAHLHNSNSCRGPGSERIRAFLFPAGRLTHPTCAPPGHTEVRCTSDCSLTTCLRFFHLMAGVLRHNGHACAPQSAGAARMCAAGTPASCSETALWWPGAALALEHNRDEISWTSKQASSSSRFEAEIGRNDWAAPEPVTGTFMGV